MSDKVFILQEPDELFCLHFFPSPDAALQWAKAAHPKDEFFLVADVYGALYLSEAQDELVNPIYVVELTQP